MNPTLKLSLITAGWTFFGMFILFCFLMGGLWAMLGLSLVLNAGLSVESYIRHKREAKGGS